MISFIVSVLMFFVTVSMFLFGVILFYLWPFILIALGVKMIVGFCKWIFS